MIWLIEKIMKQETCSKHDINDLVKRRSKKENKDHIQIEMGFMSFLEERLLQMWWTPL